MNRSIQSLIFTAIFLASSVGLTQTYEDHFVQAPSISRPEKGSIAGQYAGMTFSPGQLARGGMSLGAPFIVPQERGALQASIFPSYSTGAGLSEWGMGWTSSLKIYRARHKGHLQYDATDHWMSPWGELKQGSDGYYYPVGMSTLVRLELNNDTFRVFFSDGSVATYGDSSATQIDVDSKTYAYYLSTVEDLHGRRTELTYTSNASGRLFLKEVFYGGYGQDYQYRVAIQYVNRHPGLVDYSSGKKLVLDKQVSQIDVDVQESGQFVNRWVYTLNYAQTNDHVPFYLESVIKTYATSGQAEDVASYTYYHPGENWTSSNQLVSSPKLSDLLSKVSHADILRPSRVAIIDVNRDGQTDFERAEDLALFVQTASGYNKIDHIPNTTHPDFYLPCGSTQGPDKPRRLSRFFGDDDDAYVLHYESTSSSTTVHVCERDGVRLGQFTTSPRIDRDGKNHLRDLDGDHLPDLLHFDGGNRLYMHRNQSSPGQIQISSVAHGSGQSYLQLQGVPSPSQYDTTSVTDINGDNLLDFVIHLDNELAVWYGKGNFDFETQRASFNIPLNFGGTLRDYDVMYIDANKDGLSDMLLSERNQQNVAGRTLLINQGDHFEPRHVAALNRSSTHYYPLVADVGGDGNVQVSADSSSTGASKFDLTRASTGLMRTAYDERGTTLEFEYGRGPAVDDTRYRPIVLNKMRSISKGYDDIEYSYDYSEPVLHSENAQLLGYRFVSRSGPKEEHFSEFLIDADLPPVNVSDIVSDTQVPDLQKVTQHQYDLAEFRGILWHRIQESVSSILSVNTSASLDSVTTYEGYEGVCATSMVVTSPQDSVSTRTTLAYPPILDDSIHCTTFESNVRGEHTLNSAFDFDFTTTIHLTSLVQPEAVEVTDGQQTYLLQRVSYDGYGRPEIVDIPGEGATRLIYNGLYMLDTVETPDGLAVWSKKSPVDDLTVELVTERPGAAYKQYFAYDGQERLERTWNSLGQSSAQDPIMQYEYQYANSVVNAAVRSWRKMSDSGARQHNMEFMTAGGEKLYNAIKLGQTFKYSNLMEYNRFDGSTTRHKLQIASQNTSWGDPNNPGTFVPYPILVASRPLGYEETSIFGKNISSWQEYHSGVAQRFESDLSLTSNALITTITENQQYTKRSYLDAKGNLVRLEDELGVDFNYEYDGLNRMRRAHFPDGAIQRADYDNFGRLVEIQRTHIGRQTYAYESSVMERLTDIMIYDRDDNPRYHVELSYDSIGRTRTRTRTQLDTGDEATYTFFYDGAHADAPTQSIGAQTGFMTGVSGPGFNKKFTYREDGALLSKSVYIDNAMELVTSYQYHPDGSPRSSRREWYTTNGSLVQSSELATEPDADGFASHAYLDGNYIARLYYGRDGLIRRVGFMDDPAQTVENGSSEINEFIDNHYTSADIAQRGYVWDRTHEVLFHYDADTNKSIGITQKWAGWESSALRRYNDRGSIDYDDYAFSATSSERRHYTYDPRNFLENAWDSQEDWSYGYDATGLIEDAMVNGTAENTDRMPGYHWVTDESEHIFDEMGRLSYRQSANDEMVFEYGATGHLERVEELQNGMEWTFVYDEAGQRIAKFEHGERKRAYIDDVYFDLRTKHMIYSFDVGGQTVGVIINGTLELFPMDDMGSVIGEHKYGQDSLLSPYGQRDTTTAPAQNMALIQEGISYVKKGYDPNLRFIRMGVRDYSDEIRIFTTPDPLFLKEVEKSKSYYEANLYSYALNSPNKYTDPTGMEVCSANKDRTAGCFMGAVGMQQDAILTAYTEVANGNYGTGALSMLAAAVGTTTVAAAAVVEVTVLDPYNSATDLINGIDEDDNVKIATGAVGVAGAFLVALPAGKIAKGVTQVFRKACFVEGTSVSLINGQTTIENVEVGDIAQIADESIYRLSVTESEQSDYIGRVDASKNEDIEVKNYYSTSLYVSKKSSDKEKNWRGALGSRWVVGDIHATDVTPKLWRTLDIRLEQPDGSVASLQLLRPLWWLEQTGARAGGTINLEVTEAGLEGDAHILSIQDNVEVDSRTAGGSVVIGKIRHENAKVLHLVLDGDESQPLGVTPNHPLMSADRGEYIAAGELEIGERIRAQGNETSTVTAIVQLISPEPVYNLEVHRAKSYFVGEQKLLAHNTCFKLTSRISESSLLTREAIATGRSHQKGIDKLTSELAKGNLNPGIGTKPIGKGISEARHDSGARVYFRKAKDDEGKDVIEILGKSNKDNQQRVINEVINVFTD